MYNSLERFKKIEMFNYEFYKKNKQLCDNLYKNLFNTENNNYYFEQFKDKVNTFCEFAMIYSYSQKNDILFEINLLNEFREYLFY